MECEKEVLEVLDVLFNSGLIRGRKVFEDDILHLLSHSKYCKEKDALELIKRYLQLLGISVIKGSYYKEKPIKVFEDGSYIIEAVYGIEYDVLNNDSLLGRLIFYEDRVILNFDKSEKEYRINRNYAIRTLKEYLDKYSDIKEFLFRYIEFLEDNNDDKVLKWLKDFLSTKP